MRQATVKTPRKRNTRHSQCLTQSPDSALTQESRQCLLDESPQIFPTLTCPSCKTHLSTSQPPQVLTRYHNEGGLQENLDIFPLIKEEAYLSVNPSARPARAYLTMCSEGDITGIVEYVSFLGFLSWAASLYAPISLYSLKCSSAMRSARLQARLTLTSTLTSNADAGAFQALECHSRRSRRR